MEVDHEHLLGSIGEQAATPHHDLVGNMLGAAFGWCWWVDESTNSSVVMTQVARVMARAAGSRMALADGKSSHKRHRRHKGRAMKATLLVTCAFV